MTILGEGYRVARKPHICQWCRQKIKAGERYYFQTNVSDGLFSFKLHTECDAASRREMAELRESELWFEPYPMPRGLTEDEADELEAAKEEK